MAGHDAQLFRRGGLRPAGLYRIFPAGAPVKMGVHRRQEPFQLIFIQRGGGPPADIDTAQRDPAPAEHGPRGLHLLEEGLDIGLDHAPPAGGVVAHKGAIAALRRAEGDADIQLYLPGEETVLRPEGVFRRPDAQAPSAGGDVIVLVQPAVQGLPVHPLPDGETDGLGGLDPRQAAPGGLVVQQGQERPVDGGFHAVGEHPLVLLPVPACGDGSRDPGRLPPGPQGDGAFRADLAPLLPSAAETAVARQGLLPVVGLVREERDEHLLDGIVPVVAQKRVIHRRCASCI